jgi:hypothetical protein
MEYVAYIIISGLILGCIYYVIRQMAKRARQNELIEHDTSHEPCDASDDDFMCFLKSDGTSLTICKGVVVTGRRLF